MTECNVIAGEGRYNTKKQLTGNEMRLERCDKQFPCLLVDDGERTVTRFVFSIAVFVCLHARSVLVVVRHVRIG